MLIVAIDPGPAQTAFVTWDGAQVLASGILPNAELRDVLYPPDCREPAPLMVIEKVESFGMSVGAEVFETVYFSGQLAEFWTARGGTVERAGRREIKLHHCGTCRAKDANIRAALLDRFPQGSKKAPGPSHGIKSHLWAALALAVYWTDTHPDLPA